MDEKSEKQIYIDIDVKDNVDLKNDDIDEKEHFDKSQYITVKDFVDFKGHVAVSTDGSIVAMFYSGKFILCLRTR
jgi:hypothetical protein